MLSSFMRYYYFHFAIYAFFSTIPTRHFSTFAFLCDNKSKQRREEEEDGGYSKEMKISNL